MRVTAQDAPTQPSKPPEFEVVSIKPSDGNGPLLSVKDSRGQISMHHVTVHSFLYRAYPITADTPIFGLPKWADNDHYDFEARTGESGQDARRQMWQTMLADRLNLAAHMETRELPVFHLIRARQDQLGPGLAPSTLSCPRAGAPPIPDILYLTRTVLAGGPGASAPAAAPPDMLARFLESCGSTRQGGIVSGSMSMEAVAAQLTDLAGRSVVDRTGLEGAYRIHLNLAAPPGATAEFAPSVFTAVQDQLGLKLEPGKEQMPVLVIDRIDRPSEN